MCLQNSLKSGRQLECLSNFYARKICPFAQPPPVNLRNSATWPGGESAPDVSKCCLEIHSTVHSVHFVHSILPLDSRDASSPPLEAVNNVATGHMTDRGSGRKKSKLSLSSTLPSLPAHATTPSTASASSAGASDPGVTMTYGNDDITSNLDGPIAGSSRKGKEKKRKREDNSAEQDLLASAHHQVITKGKSDLREVKAGGAAQTNNNTLKSTIDALATPNGHEEGEANPSKKRKKRNRRRKSGPAGGLSGDVDSPSQTPPVETTRGVASDNNAMKRSSATPGNAEQADTPHGPGDAAATPLAASDEDMAKYMKLSAPSTTTHRQDVNHANDKSTRNVESTQTNRQSAEIAEEMAALKTQLETAKAEAERQAEALKLQIEELEGKLKTGKEAGDAKDEVSCCLSSPPSPSVVPHPRGLDCHLLLLELIAGYQDKRACPRLA